MNKPFFNFNQIKGFYEMPLNVEALLNDFDSIFKKHGIESIEASLETFKIGYEKHCFGIKGALVVGIDSLEKELLKQQINSLLSENLDIKQELERCKELMFEYGIVLKKDYEKMREEGKW